MTPSSLAVVVELAVLVDVEPVHPDAQLEHCAPQLCHPTSVDYCIYLDEMGCTMHNSKYRMRNAECRMHNAHPGAAGLVKFTASLWFGKPD